MLPCSCYNLHFLSRIHSKEVAVFAGPWVRGREAALPKRKLSRCRVCGGQNPRPWRFQVFQGDLFQTNHKFTNLHVCTASCVFEQMWVLRIQSRVRFVSSDLHCRGVLVASGALMATFSHAKLSFGSWPIWCGTLFRTPLPQCGTPMPLFLQIASPWRLALSAAIMFASPCGQCDRYLPKKNVLCKELCYSSFPPFMRGQEDFGKS